MLNLSTNTKKKNLSSMKQINDIWLTDAVYVTDLIIRNLNFKGCYISRRSWLLRFPNIILLKRSTENFKQVKDNKIIVQNLIKNITAHMSVKHQLYNQTRLRVSYQHLVVQNLRIFTLLNINRFRLLSRRNIMLS